MKPLVRPSGQERRSFGLREMRVVQAGEGPQRIVGYAAVFNVLSENLGGFQERIRPGAFSKTIQESDIRSLFNHDPNLVLGRTKSGTLSMVEDEIGLAIECLPPDVQWARDLMVTIDRGDVDQMSFTFSTVRDEWSTEKDVTTRDLIEVQLYDVSPVTFPAYPQTSVQARSALGMDLHEVDAALERLEAGTMTPADRALLQGLVRQVDDRLTTTPGQGTHLVEGDEAARALEHLGTLRRRLELAERV